MATTLFNILHSELINMGRSEMFNNNQITYYEDEHSFIKKVLRFDEDIELIVNNIFFHALCLKDIEHDNKFKRQWVNKFLYHKPNFQTVESFSSKVSYVFLDNEDFLNTYYSEIDSYLTGLSTSESKGKAKSIDDTRNANATLPQHMINLDVDNTILDYADDNFISRNKSDSDRDEESKSNRYDLDTLLNSRNMLDEVFNQFERECFILVW